MGTDGFERSTGVWREDPPRIGRRHRVGVGVSWRIPLAEGAMERRSRKRQEAEAHHAILHDLSVSGARLFAPLDERITQGCLLQLELGGEWTAVQVAWIGDSPAPKAQWCGVQFVHPSQRFMAEVFQAMDAVEP
ncbi:PilZ domain-containing protein [Aquihabitans sp. G128]|uniref:PilZ domain-containing protein n=1 Tax=Aquihabitans sp. G128 TaxID=2849779 RepID=UPI001C2368FE|nr:PilZ domain-containing protein [Aquihabitans sp. G128]QXC60773.1 PilZ domain-containing protein [Aquihabitans sp. G128]